MYDEYWLSVRIAALLNVDRMTATNGNAVFAVRIERRIKTQPVAHRHVFALPNSIELMPLLAPQDRVCFLIWSRRISRS